MNIARLLDRLRIRLWLVIGAVILGVPLTVVATPMPQLEYVGSFNVFDGPSWQQTPVPMSARQVAANLFGGTYTDYAISTLNSMDQTTVTHTAWLDGMFDIQYLMTAASEDFYMAPLSGKYDDYPAYSAWVCDHADCVADGFPVSAGWDFLNLNYTNYVWRIVREDAVPEPETWVLMLVGLCALYLCRRRTTNAN